MSGRSQTGHNQMLKRRRNRKVGLKKLRSAAKLAKKLAKQKKS
ncbi:MAG TPA: hypothetical protein VJQ51_11330 [Burkholderiales bacterium]|nr:hypothetical protein [Burkholderiales bacterium]